MHLNYLNDNFNYGESVFIKEVGYFEYSGLKEGNGRIWFQSY